MLIISHKSTLEFKDFLNKNNFSWIETIDNPNLDTRIADHPDLTIFKLDNRSLVVDKNMVDFYKELIKNQDIISGQEVGNIYPKDAIYNIYKGSDYYIHNDHTESHIETYMKNNNYKYLYIKQGYTRCSIVPMGDKILTSDYGIYKRLKNKIEVVLLKKESIPLDGFYNGFLGGCCGFFENTLLFNGNIERLNSYEIIKNEAKKSNIRLLYPSCSLVDTGSILFCN
ncbi:MAG: hypothetical protein E7D92_02565 [Anaerococcus sp.]|jgi:hypothetical protein|uniref:DUF6873 family GME fold protein n=1 Tax=Anaerococcus TaxID=165779 RepID=UPI001AE15487|nr:MULTISPECIES: hypothetical protein [Anaerococcus]MBP2069841.1 hypothetical protein [Anaerococcus nagyae]MDU2353462.1 hypothetical protein [Anaerococcus sp.]